MYKESFEEKLIKERKETGYSQRQVPALLNIHHTTIASYETGRTEPDIETIGKLADFYAVSLDWLVGTQGNNKRY